MEPAHRALLRTHRLQLSGQLLVSETIVPFLYQEDILTEAQVEDIESQRTDRLKTLRLLDLLPNRGPRAFHSFLRSLEDFSWVRDRLLLDLQNAPGPGPGPGPTGETQTDTPGPGPTGETQTHLDPDQDPDPQVRHRHTWTRTHRRLLSPGFGSVEGPFGPGAVPAGVSAGSGVGVSPDGSGSVCGGSVPMPVRSCSQHSRGGSGRSGPVEAV
ncbi:death domain-containing protein CRADD isoform X2 [Dicentrarchus labrax]|uniref:death domain-containing protein CRADD isoform X2 n=1 Tax=Dicentrarchus labrax TaxID=13489 RepID=UPI0021F65FF8|nr:death domain-containing protein CRADD isoform X2 [Dicentrarchus labrax]